MMAPLRRNRQRGCRAAAAIAFLFGVAAGEDSATEDSAFLNFTNVAFSNIGGKGPDFDEIQGLLFSYVTHVDGRPLDAIIFQQKDPAKPYQPGEEPPRKGHRDDFGVVNLALNSTADLMVRLFDAETNDFLEDHEFYLTFHDIDSISKLQKEVITVGGFNSYCGAEDSEVEFSQNGDGVQLTSRAVGREDDGPSSPWELTPSQTRRSVTFTFKDTAQFPLHLEVTGPGGEGGRDFLFSGVPMECAVRKKFRCEDELETAQEWPRDMRLWCCNVKKLGCPSEELVTGKRTATTTANVPHYDCSNPGYGNWTKDLRDWCCDNYQKGCNATLAPHDCQEGLWNWQHGWSAEKMTWCCEHEDLGCVEAKKPPPETYDCQPGNINPVTKWSEQKRQWCCEHTGHGCYVVESAKLKDLPPVAHCKGTEMHWELCEDLPKCASCAPQDCIFSEWGDWTVGGGCTGLCERRRTLMQANNECGTPCEGSTVQTVAREECYTDECKDVMSQDCEWSVWDSWSDCTSELGQSFRKRTINVHPTAHGIPCEGEWNQTRACGDESRIADCELSDWGNWTECTKTCGGGWKAQMRNIMKRAGHGGKPCSGTVRRTAPCNIEPCPEGGSRCQMSDWSEWSGCHPHQHILQQTRQKTVRGVAQGSGDEAFCNHDLLETKECADQPSISVECQLADWDDWSECSALCSGHRHRTRAADDRHKDFCFLGGAMLDVLNETAPCGPSCKAGVNCALSDWSDWSECSTSCGQGMTERNREVFEERSCDAFTREVKECSGGRCEPVDCKWGDWEEWSSCSATCGGGNHRRQRHVAVLPTDGGKLCDVANTSEVAPCNTQNCTHCVDGKWADWNDWSDCSATCAPAYRNRHRDMAVQSNMCGKPASGLGDEFERCEDLEQCSALEETRDCKLSDWADWSDCSASCGGVKRSFRQVLEGAIGIGKPCAGDLEKVEPCVADQSCFPKEAVNCSMEDWSDWSSCSASCDGGQRERKRNIKDHARRGGIGCNNESKVEVEGCGTKPCDPECGPCEWSDWSDWGKCNEDVEKCHSQRWRERKVKTQPGKCGRTCPTGVSKEAGNCSAPCDSGTVSFCVWSDWSDATECKGGCEFAVKTRVRDLTLVSYKTLDLELEGGEPKEDVFFKLAGDGKCNGTQSDITVCSQDTCEFEEGPKDCEFDPWSRWSDPTCSNLCERHRGIANMNEEGGKPCKGAVVEAKPCEHDCNDPGADPTNCYFSDYNCSMPVDCLFSDWSRWSKCKSETAQSYRNRTILQDSRRGGKPCDGPVDETHACNDPDVDLVDCRIGDWRGWSECSRTCGGGVHERFREIAVKPANGGSACSGPLREVDACATQACVTQDDDGDRPCELTEWADWSHCNSDGTKKRFRDRKVDAKGNGVRCNGATGEVAQCEGPVDCKMTEWTEWGSCDASCAGGQQVRNRTIEVPPRDGGEPCPRDLIVMRGCNQLPCSEDDAQVSEWSQWTECSKECGGERMRKRSVKSPPRAAGSAFFGPLVEMEQCDADEGSHECNECQDCVWAEWSEWGGCDRDCGGGQQSREREIQVPPGRGCPPCEPLDKNEIRACNTAPCGFDEDTVCIDGKWGPWSAWGPCSATCQGGVTMRTRGIDVTANHCGKAVEGNSIEHGGCNEHIVCQTDRDCEFTDWSFWSSCQDACSGLKKRTRNIRIEGRGDGEYCDGAIGQMAPCLESSECPGVKEVQDCELSDWSPWGACNAECGIGQMWRSRDIVSEGSHNGRFCTGSVRETEPCDSGKPCEEEACTPTGCQWSDWGDWSACDHDQKRRFKHVVVYPKCGGESCNHTNAEEITECTFAYHGETFCIWGDWSRFGGCSSTCGTGLKSRQRHLVLALKSDGAAKNGSENTSMEALTRLFSDHDFETSWRREVERDPVALAEGVRHLERMDARTRAAEGHRYRELAAAWLAGVFSLLAGGTAIRVLSGRGGLQRLPGDDVPS